MPAARDGRHVPDQLMPQDAASELAAIAEDAVADPDTRGFAMAGVGPHLGSFAQTVSDGEYETHVTLCAVILKEQAAGMDGVDANEFVRDVLEKFNEVEVSQETSLSD